MWISFDREQRVGISGPTRWRITLADAPDSVRLRKPVFDLCRFPNHNIRNEMKPLTPPSSARPAVRTDPRSIPIVRSKPMVPQMAMPPTTAPRAPQSVNILSESARASNNLLEQQLRLLLPIPNQCVTPEQHAHIQRCMANALKYIESACNDNVFKSFQIAVTPVDLEHVFVYGNAWLAKYGENRPRSWWSFLQPQIFKYWKGIRDERKDTAEHRDLEDIMKRYFLFACKIRRSLKLPLAVTVKDWLDVDDIERDYNMDFITTMSKLQ